MLIKLNDGEAITVMCNFVEKSDAITIIRYGETITARAFEDVSISNEIDTENCQILSSIDSIVNGKGDSATKVLKCKDLLSRRKI